MAQSINTSIATRTRAHTHVTSSTTFEDTNEDILTINEQQLIIYKINNIRKFSGNKFDDVDAWLHNFEDDFPSTLVGDRIKLKLIPRGLTNDAETWFVQNKYRLLSWAAFKIEIQDQFQSSLYKAQKLQTKNRSQNVIDADENMDTSVKEECSRLDLKWCLDEYIGINVDNPGLGQLVIAKIIGNFCLAYVVKITSANITVTPVEMFGVLTTVGVNDIYSTQCSPLYKTLICNHHFFHAQHVLDYMTKQKRQEGVTTFNAILSFDKFIVEDIYDDFEAHWPAGEETWFVHDELSQRIQCVQDKQKVLLLASTYNSAEYPVQQIHNNDGSVDISSKSHGYSNKQLVEKMSPNCRLVPSNENQHMAANVDFLTTEITLGFQGLQTSKIDQQIFKKHKHRYNICSSIKYRMTMQLTLAKPVYSFNSSVIQTYFTDMVHMTVTLINIVLRNPIYYLSFTHDSKDRDWFRTLAVP